MSVETILRAKGNDVATVAPDETVAAAAATMKRDRIGALVVSADGREILGILSERDIARAVADHNPGPGAMKVKDLMTREVVTCTIADTTAGIMSVMTEMRVRHLPVVKDGAMCGLVSIGDVVKCRLEEVENEAEAMREYIAGA